MKPPSRGTLVSVCLLQILTAMFCGYFAITSWNHSTSSTELHSKFARDANRLAGILRKGDASKSQLEASAKLVESAPDDVAFQAELFRYLAMACLGIAVLLLVLPYYVLRFPSAFE